MGNKTIYFFVFCLAIALTFVAGEYKNINDNERLRFSFELPAKKETSHIIDIQKQGFVKKNLQTNTISLYGLGKVNAQTGKIYAHFSGLPHHISQGSKKTTWNKLNSTDELQVNKKQYIPISIELQIPKELMNKYQIANTELNFFDGTKNLGTIKFIVVDSKYKKETI